MKKDNFDLYRDYLRSTVASATATATGLCAMLNGEMRHDKMTWRL